MSPGQADPADGPPDPMARNGRRCKARARSTGNQCRQLALDGLEVCHYHGGASPQARTALSKRLADVELAEVVDGIDVRNVGPLHDPAFELRLALAQQVAMKDELLDRLAVTPEDSPLYSTTADLAVVALDRVTRRLLEAARINEDLTRGAAALSRRNADRMVKAVTDAVEELGVDLEADDGRARDVIAGHFQILADEDEAEERRTQLLPTQAVTDRRT